MNPHSPKSRFRLPSIFKMGKYPRLLLAIIVCCIQAKANSQTHVTLHIKNGTLEAVLKEIRQQTGYMYALQDQWKQKAKQIDISVDDVSLEEALNICFKDQPFEYRIINKTIVIQERQPKATTDVIAVPPVVIRGVVTDSLGIPLAGASVTVQGTKLGTSTDEKGNFSLEIANKNPVLLISFTGYERLSYKVKGSDPFIFTLRRVSSALDEIHVIAYGEVSKRLQTGNVTTIKAADIDQQPISNVLLALEGRVPGLFITQNSGNAGTGVAVRLQGQNSIANGNDPLYVIDGVPYTGQMLSTTSLGSGILGYSGGIGNGGSNNGGVGNPLSLINPADIESISILKDADATAIYGSRAANGALLITTKKGKAGKTKYDVNVQQGSGTVVHHAKLLNTDQYLEMRREALQNDGVSTPSSTDYDINGTWDTTRFTDWQKTIIGKTSLYSDANLGISGGTSNVQYLIGGTFHRETSVYPGSFNDEKGALHFNINSISENQKLTVQISVNYLIDNNQLPSFDLANSAATYLAPDAPKLYSPDGSLNWEPAADGTSTWSNPLAYVLQTYQIKTKNAVSNGVLSYKIIPGLEFRANFGYTDMLTNELLEIPLISDKPEIRPFASRIAEYSTSTITSWIAEPQLSFKKSISKGVLTALAGTTIQENNDNGTNLLGIGYNSDAVLADVHSAATVIVNPTVNSVYKYNALFGRLNFAWDNEYLIDLNMRRDGSSRFGPLSQFHNFGSGALAWIFTGNDFVKRNLTFLSFGKIKGSYGLTGNDQIGDYSFLTLYTPIFQAVPYQGQTALSPANLTNPYLQWEETKKLQFGADFGFLRDRVSLSANYAINKSSNQLLPYNLPTTTGFGYILANFPATVQNTSWEFTISSRNIDAKRFKWTTNINLTVPRNKLLSFPGLENSTYADQLVIGQPLNIAKVFHSLGVDPTTGVYQFADAHGQPTFSPQYGTDNNVVVTTNPYFYGGFQNSFNYRGFELGVLFQFVEQKGNMSFLYGNNGNPPGYRTNNQYTFVLNRWQHPGEITPVEKYNSDLSLANALGYLGTSDIVYNKDASFVRLKNVSFSYDLPKKYCSKVGIDNARIYIHGQNVLTLTRYKGLDPETQTALPPLRTVVLGLQIAM